MKKIVLVLISSIISSTSSFSQPCLPDGISFESQEQIDNFQLDYPNCTEIEGEVEIGIYNYSNDITNVDGLSVLTSMGSLWIFENEELISLDGFSNLQTVGTLFIYENDALTDLSGLESLSEINDELVIHGNSSLTEISALGNVTFIGSNLHIQYNNSLSNLDGLNNVTFIDGEISISNNNDLTSLLPLENISTINGDLMIVHNSTLTSLMGINNIDPESIENLTIVGNNSLSHCEVQSICQYLSNISGKVRIFANETGCNNPSEIADSCGIILPCLPFGDYYFFSQSDIDNFQSDYMGCFDLKGNVFIKGSDISDLEGLNSITSIEHDLNISDNLELEDLSGLENLISIGGQLDIDFNSGLASLQGLNGLSSIGSDLKIQSNSSLIDLQGLNNLNSIGISISINTNNSMNSLSGIENLDPYSIMYLTISSNSNLSNCNVESICSYLIDVNGTSIITSNSPGCNNKPEVIEACEATEVQNKVSVNNFSFFPNPAKNEINIVNNSPEQPRNIIIYNQLGQKILIIEEISEKIDISTIPAGLYIIELSFCSYKIRTKLTVSK